MYRGVDGFPVHAFNQRKNGRAICVYSLDAWMWPNNKVCHKLAYETD